MKTESVIHVDVRGKKVFYLKIVCKEGTELIAIPEKTYFKLKTLNGEMVDEKKAR